MKITYLKLKNFVNIMSGMKKPEIEIDFSKSENKLIVLSGKNGSGKTSILSELHPFASCGNMDVRSDTCLIKEGMDGYKEIHIQNNTDKYIIKHFYMFKNKNKSVKSYISKNGEDLNSNGNVKSFKEQVYNELGIDQDLLKLMRLGSNVTSLINMKATNRKAFATKLFSDIDIYNNFYKKVSEEYRNIRAVMKNISDKLSKYNVTDIGDFENEISILSNRIITNEKEKQSLIKQIAVNENKIKDLVCSDYDAIESKWNHLNETINNSEKKLLLIKDIDENETEYKLISERNINKINTDINSKEAIINKEISEKDIYFNQIQDLENKLKTSVSSTRLNNIQDNIKSYEDKIKKLEMKLSDRTRYNKSELLRLKDNMRLVSQAYNSLNQYKTSNVRIIADLMLKNKNVEKELSDNRVKIENEISYLNETNIKSTILEEILGKEELEFKCNKECPYMYFYKNLHDKLNENYINNDKLVELKKDLLGYDELYDIYRVMLNIADIINNLDLQHDIPIEYDINIILTNICDRKPLFNTNILNLAIDDAESFELLDEYILDKNKISEEYKTIKDFGLDTITIENQILMIKDKINKNDSIIKSTQEEINKLKEEKNKCIEKDNNILQALKLKSNLNQLKEDFKDVDYRLKEVKYNIELKNELEHSNSQLQNTLDKINSSIQLDNKHKEELDYKLKEYSNLTNEYNALNLLFKDINEIRDALNASTGIPLLYLNVYLKNCPILMNTLLESVFDGQLQIDRFIINENEFRIPFITKGILVPDIINASQGESSFISIVLSLSLIIQSMTTYDIICLDELDGPLDNKNRQEFINILYKFIEQVNCEQVFLITHNNMFDNEPVDLILTSDTDTDNFKYGNIIFKN